MKKLITLLLLAISVLAQAGIDSTIGCQAPKNVSKNYKLLAHHLCDSLENDEQKLNAIYNWVTHNIDYDVKSIHRSKLRTDKPNEVLKRGKTICGGYADLVTAMCKEVGIRAQTILGYYKDWKFDDGDKFFIPNHAWNAVLVNNKWEYLDATAGAGYTTLSPNWFQRLMGKINKNKLYTAKKPKFVREYDPKLFMPSVEEFRIKRLPADPLWQLSDTAMPLKIFEAGKSNIIAFNDTYAQPQQFSVKLSDIYNLSWDEQVLECAERTYNFNPRYSSMLARKKFVESTYNVVAAVNKESKIEGRALLTEAKKGLDQTKEIQMKQKQVIVKETAILKQKNKDKTASFKKYKRALDKDNKQKKTAMRMRRKQAGTAINIINRKRTAIKKKPIANSAQTIAGIKTMPTNTPASSPALQRLADSVQARGARLQLLAAQIKNQQKAVQSLEKQNENLLQEAIEYYEETDSLLYEETKARFEMNDDYDPEVKSPQRVFKEIRYAALNQTIDQFTDNFDSIKSGYKNLIRLYTSRATNYKNNLKSIEQYKRQNDETSSVLSQYSPTILAAQASRKNYLAMLADYEQSMKNNITVFEVLEKAHERELEFTRLMSLAENKRNELEAKKIKKDAEWLKAANKKTKKICTNAKKEADRLFKLHHANKSKRWEKELKKMEARAKAED